MQIVYHGSYCKVEKPEIKEGKNIKVVKKWGNHKKKMIYFLYVV